MCALRTEFAECSVLHGLSSRLFIFSFLSQLHMSSQELNEMHSKAHTKMVKQKDMNQQYSN